MKEASRPGVRSLPAAALAATALAGCAPVLHEADLVRATPVMSAGAGVSRTDSAYGNAVAAIDRRDYARALELLQIARQQGAGDVRVLNALGVVYDKLGRFDLSRRYYAEAARADPNSTIVQANIAYSQRLQDGSSGGLLADAPILKVGPPSAAAPARPTPQLRAEQAPVAMPQKITVALQPAAPPQQVETIAALKVRKAGGLSGPAAMRMDGPEQVASPPTAAQRITVALQPAAPPQQVETIAALKVRKAGGLSGPAAMRMDAPALVAPPPRAPQTIILALQPAAPAQQLEAVGALKVRKAGGLSKPAVMRMDAPAAAAPEKITVALQPAAPVQQVEGVAPLKVRKAVGLSRPVAMRIETRTPAAPAAAAAPARVQLAVVVAAPAPPRQIQALALAQPQLVTGMTRPTAPHFEATEAATPPARPAAPIRVARAAVPLAAPRAAASLAVAKAPAVQRTAALRIATPRLQPAAVTTRLAASGRQPLRIVNATGHVYRAEPIRASLAGLGWSAPRWAMAQARPQTRTVIIYPPSRLAVAKALARTLPGSTRLAACTNGCAGLQLVLGADARGWKPLPRTVIRTPRRDRIA